MITASYMQVPLESFRIVSKEEWEESIPLDAPDCIPSGSRYKYVSKDGEYVWPLSTSVERYPYVVL